MNNKKRYKAILLINKLMNIIYYFLDSEATTHIGSLSDDALDGICEQIKKIGGKL